MQSPGLSVLANATLTTLIAENVRAHDLPALCLSCKALNAPAERQLYKAMHFNDPPVAYRACQTLSATPRLAQHVRVFAILHRPAPRYQQHALSAPLPLVFWQALARALALMLRLDTLVLADPSAGRGPDAAYTWVLPAAPAFQLHEVRFQLPWDARAAAFFALQRQLRSLQVTEVAPSYGGPSAEEQAAQADAAAAPFPALQVLDVPFRMAVQFLGSPLTHVQVFPDREADVDAFSFVPHLWRVRKTLRALSLHDIPEHRTGDVVRLVAKHCPNVQYLGILPLPPVSRSTIHSPLLALARLAVLELDLSRWAPAPPAAMQRALAAEIHTYCPQLRVLILWLSTHRFAWRLNLETGAWQGRMENASTGPGWRSI